MSLLGSSILIGAIATTSSSSSGGGVTAHSALTGLTTGNDHTQYLLKAGGTMTGALVTSAGTAALPAVAVAQSNLGLFQAATNTLGFATAGNERMRITSGGNLLLGTSTDSNSKLEITRSSTECVAVVGALSGANLFSHAYTDKTTFTSTSTGGYASVDSTPTMEGSIDYNHFYSFQARHIYDGSGTLDAMSCFVAYPTIHGPVSNARGLHVYNALGVGVVTEQVGIFIEDLTRGTNNYAFYSGGSAPSYHGGVFQLGAQIIATNARFTDYTTYGALLATDASGNTITNPNLTIVNGVLTMANGTTSRVLASASSLELASTSSHVVLSAGGSERMRITSAGNVLIGTTTDLASSILTMGSTTKGFLPPRMTGTQRDAISSPATGLVVYNTTTDKLNFYNGSAWEAVTSA